MGTRDVTPRILLGGAARPLQAKARPGEGGGRALVGRSAQRRGTLARATSRSMLAPSRCQPVASQSVQVQNRTAPSAISMPTEIVSVDPHVEQLVCLRLRLAFIPSLSAAERVLLHGPTGPFSLVRWG